MEIYNYADPIQESIKFPIYLHENTNPNNPYIYFSNPKQTMN